MTYIPPDPRAARFGPDGRGNIVMLPQEEIADTPTLSPGNLLANLLAILSDPDAFRKRVVELAAAEAKSRQAIDEAKQARDERDRLDAEIERIRKATDEKITAELSAHTVELQRRTTDADRREQDVAKRERDLEQAQAKLEKGLAWVAKKRADLAAE